MIGKKPTIIKNKIISYKFFVFTGLFIKQNVFIFSSFFKAEKENIFLFIFC